MKAELRRKLDRIFGACKNADSIFIKNTEYRDPNFTYLTNFKSGLFEGNFLILNKRGLTLFTDSLEYTTALQQKFSGLKIIKIGDQESTKALLNGALRGKSIGVNGSFLPYATYKNIRTKFKPRRILDVSGGLLVARLVKESYEIDDIKNAAKITKMAMEEIQGIFKEGISEKDLARKFDDISESLGSEGPSFDTIVCFGRNSALPHHTPDRTRLKDGDFILIDAGSKFNNYCSDVTRTFIFGNGNTKQKNLLRIVKEAQNKTISQIKPGAKGKDIDKYARNYIDTVSAGIYKDKFIHSLGHSLGIEVHDGEGFSPSSELILKENMVITVEPGVYLYGFGGVRVEDDILITRNGCKIL